MYNRNYYMLDLFFTTLPILQQCECCLRSMEHMNIARDANSYFIQSMFIYRVSPEA